MAPELTDKPPELTIKLPVVTDNPELTDKPLLAVNTPPILAALPTDKVPLIDKLLIKDKILVFSVFVKLLVMLLLEYINGDVSIVCFDKEDIDVDNDDTAVVVPLSSAFISTFLTILFSSEVLPL